MLIYGDAGKSAASESVDPCRIQVYHAPADPAAGGPPRQLAMDLGADAGTGVCQWQFVDGAPEQQWLFVLDDGKSGG